MENTRSITATLSSTDVPDTVTGPATIFQCKKLNVFNSGILHWNHTYSYGFQVFTVRKFAVGFSTISHLNTCPDSCLYQYPTSLLQFQRSYTPDLSR